MSEAHDYEDMRWVLEHLTPPQVRRLRLIISQDEELAPVVEVLTEQAAQAEAEQAGEVVPADLLALIGSVDTGRTDGAENHDHYIRERMRRRRERWA